MNVNKLTIGQQRALFFSLKDQYEKKRPMTIPEEQTMWELQNSLWQHNKGFGFGVKINIKQA